MALSGQLILAVSNSSVQLAWGFQHLSRLPPPGIPWPCCCQNTPQQSQPNKAQSVSKGRLPTQPSSTGMEHPSWASKSSWSAHFHFLPDRQNHFTCSEWSWCLEHLCWDIAEIGCLDFILCPGLSKAPCPHIHLPKSSCQPFLGSAWKGHLIPWASTEGWHTPGCASSFPQVCFHNHLSGSSRDVISAKLPFLLGIYYWCFYGSHLRLRPRK